MPCNIILLHVSPCIDMGLYPPHEIEKRVFSLLPQNLSCTLDVSIVIGLIHLHDHKAAWGQHICTTYIADTQHAIGNLQSPVKANNRTSPNTTLPSIFAYDGHPISPVTCLLTAAATSYARCSWSIWQPSTSCIPSTRQASNPGFTHQVRTATALWALHKIPMACNDRQGVTPKAG